jgi:hypothetical protein
MRPFHNCGRGPPRPPGDSRRTVYDNVDVFNGTHWRSIDHLVVARHLGGLGRGLCMQPNPHGDGISSKFPWRAPQIHGNVLSKWHGDSLPSLTPLADEGHSSHEVLF